MIHLFHTLYDIQLYVMGYFAWYYIESRFTIPVAGQYRIMVS